MKVCHIRTTIGEDGSIMQISSGDAVIDLQATRIIREQFPELVQKIENDLVQKAQYTDTTARPVNLVDIAGSHEAMVEVVLVLLSKLQLNP